MKSPVFFESAGDERGTPQEFFDRLNAEFHFDIDVAATPANKKCELYFGEGSELGMDALEQDWGGMTCFMNPPYSVAGAFVAKAREEADKGATVVNLLPVRSDTRYWHRYIWDVSTHNWRPGVRVRFVPGRLNFELHVPQNLRDWVKSELSSGTEVKSLSDVTGLPKMAIERIGLDMADDCLLEGAPFPSCVAIFTKVEQS